MPHKPGSKAYRDQQRERLVRLGVDGRQLIEQLVADLIRCGRRPREAWRLAWELTQDEAAARFNQIAGDANIHLRGSRICEYEKWPIGGVRPSVRVLKILAAIYETTWDRLIDIDDLQEMPADDRQAFLSIGDLHNRDSLDSRAARQRSRYRSVPRYNALQLNQPLTPEKSVIVHEQFTVPAQRCSPEQSGGELPAEITHFTGRAEPMAELRARITEQTSQGTVLSIYAIDGMAGVGKTAFARHAAQQLAASYPDGAIWVDLYGHTPGMQPREPSSALEQMLLQLGVSPEAIKANVAERRDQWRHHVHGRRMLIILDNALTSDQVLPLLPDAPGCLVLITSRRKLTGLTDAYPISLDILAWDEAERLFIKLVGENRCDDRDAVRQILTACARLPLAIRLIAGRLRHHRDELLTEVVGDFVDQTAALDAFVAEHLSVRAAFEWSYRLLTDAQRRTFRLLGWHPGPEITLVVVAAVAALSHAQGKQVLRELVDHNLLEQLSITGVPGGQRYRMHDLVRLYARERADAEESPAERVAAVDRLALSYLAITCEADRLLRPYAMAGPKAAVQRAVLTFADAAQARTWLTVERLNLLGCVRAMSPTTEAADLSTVLAAHFSDFGFWSDVRCLYGRALTVYRHLGYRRGEVDSLLGLGEVERFVGECGQARMHYNEALILTRQLDDRRAEADALRGLGEVERLVGDCHQARAYDTQALALARQLGDRRTEADALWGLGQVEKLVGEYRQAREYHTEALALARDLGYRFGEANALWGLGQVEKLVGEYRQAREYYTEALSLARQLGDRRAEADVLRGLGQVERLTGKYSQAREYETQALTLARQLGFRRVEADALRGLGEVERLTGKYSQARECHTQALALARQLGCRRIEADALRGLGEVERFADKYGQAHEYYTKSLVLSQHLGYRFGEAGALRGLGEVEQLAGKYGEANEYETHALALARQFGDQRVEAEALGGLGEVERLIGKYELARDYYMQALILARRLGYRRAEAEALWGLGEVERFTHEYAGGRKYHTQALAIARQLGDRRIEANALSGLGYIAADTEERSQACESWRKALEIYEELGVSFAQILRTAMRRVHCRPDRASVDSPACDGPCANVASTVPVEQSA